MTARTTAGKAGWAPAVASLTWDQVRAWRVTRQHLAARAPAGRLVEVVGEVCGLQAQVQSAAELQAWARVEDVTVDEVRDALWRRRALVRTWAMRGTLHVLPAAELPAYVGALRTHDRWSKGAWLRVAGMTEAELRAVVGAVGDTLAQAAGAPLAREELAGAVAARVGEHTRERLMSGWGGLLKPSAFAGTLASGPPRGQAATFVHPAHWLGGGESGWAEPPAPEEAWRAVVRRYLGAYAPAAREEFGRWWGTQPAPAGRVLKASAGELAEVDAEGYRGFALAGDVAGMAALPPVAPGEGDAPAAPARLLPAFDVYTIGTRPRASLVAPGFEDRVFRKAGWVSPVVLVDGWAAGVWEHERRGGRVEVTVTPFRPLPGVVSAQLAEEAERLGRFLGAPVVLSVAVPGGAAGG